MEIAGSRALVTGGASGLGLGTARVLSKRGAVVTIFDLPSADGAAAAAQCGDGSVFVPGDVRSEDDVTRALDAGEAPRIVVNCAGIGVAHRIVGRDGPFPLDDFVRVIEVNLVGTFNVMRLAAARMSGLEPSDGERGVIVNTASIAGYEGQVGQAAYAASKAGIIGLTVCAARDLGGQLIRVNTIAPGSFDTPLQGQLPDALRQAFVAAIPHPRREGRPDEFAALVVHIVENQMLNGETIRLDAGLRLPPR